MNSHSTSRGPFIVLEGIDGSGTTTQVQRLAEGLRSSGRQVHTTCEPTAGPIGRFLREALQGKLTDAQGELVRLDWAAMALLFAADRVDHVAREIEPALSTGQIVICDRYDLSSLLYQSFTSPLGESVVPWLKQINAQVLRPDLTLVLDLPSEVAEARRAVRGGETEIYEQGELQRRLGVGYRQVSSLLPRDRSVVVDASGPISEVEGNLLEIIDEFLTLRAAAQV